MSKLMELAREAGVGFVSEAHKGAFFPFNDFGVSQLERFYSLARADLLAEIAELLEANEAFGKRQEWWTERMCSLEAENEQLSKERQAFKDVAEYQKAENAQLLADLKVCQAKNRELNTALDEWIDKTDWVQKTATSMEIGLHRADVLKQRIAGRAALGETK